MNLKEQLDALTQQNMAMIPAQAASVMKQAQEELARSNIQSLAIKPGSVAADFSLPNVSGQIVNLTNLLNEGPVIITFYRGAWCPYCNLTLRALQESLPELKKAGGQLVAISPQLPDASLSTVEKNELTFEVLSDSGNRVAKTFGIVFTLSKNVLEVYKSFGIDLQSSNGTTDGELPLAATYIIDTGRIVKYAHVETDYTKRMEPSDIVSIIKKLECKRSATFA